MQLALFIIFGILAVAGALNLLFQRHPINSALSLIVVMMSLAVLYFSLGAEFLAAAQVIVYAGAIMVLFVSRVAYIVGIPGAAAIFCLLTFVFLKNKAALGTTQLGGYLNNTVSNLTDISHSLFTTLLLPFEVTSILILVAILGAVVLARKEL
jgi:NADH-quinone oxidoreductase subunit J